MATVLLDTGGDSGFQPDLIGLIEQGTPTVVTDIVHGGHIKSTKYAPAAGDTLGYRGTVQDAGARASVYIYLNALPGATATIMGICQSAFGTDVIRVRLTSAGVLQLWSNTAQIGINGSTLSTGQWYRLCIAYTATSTTINSIKLFKNGTVDITVSNGTLGVVTSNEFYVGNASTNATLDMRSADLYIDNSNTVTDTGDIWVTAKRPFSNGTTNNFASSGTGSGYGTGNARFVNIRPLDGVNLVSTTPTTVQTEEYSIEGKSVGDIDISTATIIDYMGWIRANVASTANSPVDHIIVGGVTTLKTLTTSFATYTQVAGSVTYPAGNTDIGMDAAYTTTGHLVQMDGCGINVAYTPGAAPIAKTGRLPLLGVG